MAALTVANPKHLYLTMGLKNHHHLSVMLLLCHFKGAPCSFGEWIQIQNCNSYDIGECIIVNRQAVL